MGFRRGWLAPQTPAIEVALVVLRVVVAARLLVDKHPGAVLSRRSPPHSAARPPRCPAWGRKAPSGQRSPGVLGGPLPAVRHSRQNQSSSSSGPRFSATQLYGMPAVCTRTSTASSSNSSPCPTWAINAWRDIARTAALCTTCTSHWPLFESLPPSSCGGRLAGREQAPPGGARDDASPTQCMQSPTLVHKNRPACRGSSRGAGWRPRRPACPGGDFFSRFRLWQAGASDAKGLGR